MSQSDVNQVTFTGRLTRNPENRNTPSGAHVCDFTIASNRYTANGKQHTTFVRVTLWNKAAEVVGQKLEKGDFVLVTGVLVNDDFRTQSGEQTNGRMKVDHAEVIFLRKANTRELS